MNNLKHIESHYYIDESPTVYSNASGELKPIYTFITKPICGSVSRTACWFCFGQGKKDRKLRYVHRLFAEAYIDNPSQFRYVCAKDKCLSNISKENLYWSANPRGVDSYL